MTPGTRSFLSTPSFFQHVLLLPGALDASGGSSDRDATVDAALLQCYCTQLQCYLEAQRVGRVCGVSRRAPCPRKLPARHASRGAAPETRALATCDAAPGLQLQAMQRAGAASELLPWSSPWQRPGRAPGSPGAPTMLLPRSTRPQLVPRGTGERSAAVGTALGWYLVPIGLHAHHPIIPCCRRCSPVIYGIGMPLPPRLLTRTATYGLSVGRSHTAAQ